ncbi:MAG: hypothetical protein ACOX3K_01660 [Bacilli bacterium]|jgi:hypothetical protein
MKFTKKKTWITLTAGFALAAGVLGAADLTKTNPNLEAGAATPQSDRRIYVVLEQYWGNDMYIHYWGGGHGTDWNNCPKMIKVVSDYYAGLFYWDVPVGVTDFLVKTSAGNVGKTSDQSNDIAISNLQVGTNYKAAQVKPWVADHLKRDVTFPDTLPSNSGQAAAILGKIESCENSHASGYNAWPQLNDLFISPSSLDGNTSVYELNGNTTTITNKIAMLQREYAADQASPVLIFNDQQKNIPTILIVGVLGLVLLGAFIFSNRKRIA